MAILLRWAHRNSGSFTTKIFRSDTEFTPATKPSDPIATLTNDEVQWSDTNVEFGKFYYYLIQISRDSIVLDSQVRMMRETVESPWGTITNDSLHDSILGGSYDFGYAGAATWDSLYDLAGEEILRRCGYTGDYRGTYDRIVLGGRYFLVPSSGVQCVPATMIANNMFLGHRQPPLPAAVAPGSFGTNDPFIWKGRKWSVGLPRYKNEAGVSPVALMNAIALKDTNGFCTSKYLTQWESSSFMINAFSLPTMIGHALPKETGLIKSLGSSAGAGLLTCEPVPAASQGSLQCFSVYNNGGTPSESQYNANTASAFTFYPFIEYLGVA